MKQRLAFLLLLAGCAAQRAPTPPPAADPYAWYRAAALAGTPVYRIDPQASVIRAVVRSGGPFARMGHDHAVAAKNISGFAAPGEGRADFGFRLDEMTVDEPAVRASAGLPGTVPADAAAGTRANMLGRVLEADRHPTVHLSARQARGAAGTMRLAVTLHGVTRSVDVPAALDITPASVTAAGSFSLRQTDFGIKPMSVLGGALVVRDEMELSFRIHAARVR
ncbi:YceI family protein [Massilia sp. GCM10020059]|uniref:YceI family protein n=1 Tax=Massilia agrisoli TaxID=2892444 RepID=A0ABS8ITW3_9BURK|nr:YceI family protein [Massilia agrisoli]MCC6072050.1 YceI family protein [Massilia agrisoli]